jgi:glutamate-ammonia-ligase adenylyltransferase
VGAQLSTLAEALIDSALEVVARPLGMAGSTGFAVIALGKLGSQELDYASDLDLIFVHDFGIEGQERMARLGQRLVSGLGAMMGQGRLYEVDLRLRPSGNQGLLVSSLDAFRAYHATEGQIWERQVLIQARAVAGDLELGRAVERIAEEAAFERSLPPPAALAQEISAMRRRIESELSAEDPERYDMKFGRGGMVDVEFLVQYMQLRHGGERPALRVRGTLPALDALAAQALGGGAAHAVLRDGYEFFRRLKGRVRIVQDRSSVELPKGDTPDGASELDKLARRMGYREADAASRLGADFLATRERVRAEVTRLLPAVEGEAAP